MKLGQLGVLVTLGFITSIPSVLCQAPKELVLFSLLRSPIALDGTEGAGWQGLQKAGGLIDPSTSTIAEAQTDAMSAYDDSALYFSLEMKVLQGVADDEVEIWLAPSDGTCWQFVIDRNGFARGFLWKAGVSQSLENVPETKVVTTGEGWTAQIKIPWTVFGASLPQDNSHWRFNFLRRWIDGKGTKMWTTWSPVRTPDQVANFGRLAFYSKAEVEADLAYWENNDNDPLLRRAFVSGAEILARTSSGKPRATLWSYDPFAVDRSATEKWGCLGLTSERAARSRGRLKSAEKDYPEFFRVADQLNWQILKLAEVAVSVDQLERAFHYAKAMFPDEKLDAAPLHAVKRERASIEAALDGCFASYSAAFLANWDKSKLSGLDVAVGAVAKDLERFQEKIGGYLLGYQELARRRFSWSPSDTIIPYEEERRDADGVPRRYWFCAYGLSGAEPIAQYFAPFRSWTLDWPNLLASRAEDGSFSLPHVDTAFDRLASADLKVNFHSGIGLVSFKMPTSPWLETRIAEDPNILAHSQDGIAIPKDRVGSMDAFLRRGINIESPVVQEYAREYLGHLMSRVNRDGRVDFVVNGWEDGTTLRIYQEGKITTRLRGYDPLSKRAFQEYLKDKYGTVASLNEKWGATKYRDFSEISPPNDSYLSPGQKAGGLSYEWLFWLRKSYFEWTHMLRDAVKAEAAGVPVMADSSHLLMEGAGLAEIRSKSVDILSFHYNPNFEEGMFAYLSSLTRRYGVALACFENYCLMYSRLEGNNERLGARAMRRFFADLIACDVRVLSFWLSYSANATAYVAAYGGANFRIDNDQTILRWPTAELPVFMKQVQRLERPLVESAPEKGKLAVLLPDSSFLQTQYLRGDSSKETAMEPVIKFQTNILAPKNVPAEYLHEDELADGSVDLSAYSVVFVPEAAYLRRKVLADLRAWAGQPGHHLIVAGPLGDFDEYGQPLPAKESPLRSAFTADPGAASKEKVLESVSYGRGTVTRLTLDFDEVLANRASLKVLQDAVAEAAVPLVKVDDDKIRLQLRRGQDGESYLLVSNRDLRKARSFQISLPAAYREAYDLGVPGWFPVSIEAQDGQSTFQGFLSPGDWTLLLLKPESSS